MSCPCDTRAPSLFSLNAEIDQPCTLGRGLARGATKRLTEMHSVTSQHGQLARVAARGFQNM